MRKEFTNTTEETKKFEAGKTYYSRGVRNYEQIYTIEVIKRTAKTVTYICDGEQRRTIVDQDKRGNEFTTVNTVKSGVTLIFRAEHQYDGLKSYKVTADCLVEDCLVEWTIKAADEEEAWCVGCKLAQDSPVADGGTVDVMEIMEDVEPDQEEPEQEAAAAGREPSEAENVLEAWRNAKVSVTMTNDQWTMLNIYLLMTADCKKDEIKVWERMAKETDADGKPKFPNAAENADFWRSMVNTVENVTKMIDNR